MTKAISVGELQVLRDQLQAEHNALWKERQDATERYAQKKAELLDFDDRYARVLQMLED